jgi:signal recognition particle subunit SRP68
MRIGGTRLKWCIFKEREEVLLVGDYNAYRAHTTRKLQKLRKKLGQKYE